jgi:hypothetical protein
MEACADESIYEFEPAGDASVGLYSNSCHKTPSVISSGGSRSHRRKRLRENLAQLAQEGETPVLKTRRSAFANTARRSLNVSALDNVAADSTIIGESSYTPSLGTCKCLGDYIQL